MPRAIVAAALYFAMVFTVGFTLGPVRVLLLEPRLGRMVATLIETPFLLTAIALAAPFVARRLRLSTSYPDLLTMGFGAAALGLLADFTVGLWLRNFTPAEQFATFATPAGGLYLALIAILALAPLVVVRRHA
jgi:hypothetical protein